MPCYVLCIHNTIHPHGTGRKEQAYTLQPKIYGSGAQECHKPRVT